MEKGGILSADDNLGRPAESKMPKTDIGDWMNTGGILSLDDNLSETQDVVDETEDRFKELGDLIQGWGRDSAAAIVDFAAKGKGSFKDLIDSMIQDLLRMMVYQNLTQPFFSWASGGLKGIFSAKGNVFDGGSMVPFARGGVVNRPTIFPMAHGLGLMGEAGPEAVMPLKRTASGDLGVVSGSGGEGMSIFIHAVDAKSFDDLCRRNPGAITDQIMKSLRDNKVRTEMRDLVR